MMDSTRPLRLRRDRYQWIKGDNRMPTRREVLDMISQDAEHDAMTLDGQPFNGRTVAEQFGNHGASIQALAKIVESLLPEDE